ncbi:putative TPX2 family protein [Tripterygium wilfordii]|uniref:Putative TPX2 family protein n=1 Tax=Tripterygium wilfordii TaxID=458696 RepID=A0A7J7DFU1_TRIWF|nr:protein WVD2-like 7 [Tripterygium wilfordii]XP_038706817.1 protein WVD2-like 7 [Tripterygium wilfordii]XP_038706818.1 protein WVD2-like 7 [Tripterygium wilfordii]KAF5745202.1 putative TPX2 family protein [Tripterygium wilfordii]
MAGEIEEPFSFSFQADSFRSGSISFGRYENESLSWERRSSFSHNRYLEEVEKCSRPGSVIEKKAYFEAHFKKKALRHQNSSESQNGEECDNEVLENMNYREEYDNVNEGSGEERNQLNYVDDASHFAHFKEELENVDYGEGFDRGNRRSQFGYLDDSGTHCAYYDESPKGLEHRKECEVAACGVENPMVFRSGLEIEAPMSKSNSSIYGFQEDGTQETSQTEICPGKLLVDDGETEMEVNQRADDISTSFESSRAFNLSPKNRTAKKVDKSSLEPRRTHSAKLMAAAASKSTKLGLKSLISAVAKGASSDQSKTSAKNQNIMDKERPKKEKHPSQAAIPTRHSLIRNAKKEDTERTKTKQNIESKSEKDIRAKKVTHPQSSASKVEPRAHDSPNRLKHTVASTKLDVKTSAATFNFKSSERAERRKEFYKKLEKETDTKEAEMNQLQAKTQEKKEAEIKQFRRSLNFKATPMPSFYSAGSIGSKAASSKHQPGKVRNNLNAGAAVKSTPLLKTGNDWTLLATESLSPTDPPESSEGSICTGELSEVHALPLTPPTDTNSHPEAIAKDRIARKKEQGKMQKHQVPANNKMTKDLKVRGKLKAGARRNDCEVARKQMRGIEIGNSSRMRHLTLGVAS